MLQALRLPSRESLWGSLSLVLVPHPQSSGHPIFSTSPGTNLLRNQSKGETYAGPVAITGVQQELTIPAAVEYDEPRTF